MRKFSIFTAVAVSISAVIPASAVMAQWPSATRGNVHKRIIEIGGGGFDRPGTGDSTPVITEGLTGRSLFDADEGTSVGGAAGLDLKYQFESRRGRTWRFRSIVADFDNINTITSPLGLQSSLFPEDTETDTLQYDYDSRLLSFEMMSCRNLAPGINFVAGPRFLSLREEIRTEVDGEVDFGIGTPLVDSSQVNTLTADNSLIGLQVGLEFTVPLTRYFYAESFIRGGGYFNPTEVSSSQQDFLGGQSVASPALGAEINHGSESFLGEVGGRLFVDFVPGSVAGYIGYEATWIDGIALAPAQLLASSGSVDTSNTLFYQAVTFGLRMQF